MAGSGGEVEHWHRGAVTCSQQPLTFELPNQPVVLGSLLGLGLPGVTRADRRQPWPYYRCPTWLAAWRHVLPPMSVVR